MNALLDQIAKGDAATRASALATYSEILARQSNPLPGDADALRGVMEVLDIDQQAVADDAAVVRSVTDHEQTIAQATNAEDDKQRRARVELATANLDRLQREFRAAEDEHAVAWRDVQNSTNSVALARAEAARIRRDNPRAFGQGPAAPVAPASRRVGWLQHAATV